MNQPLGLEGRPAILPVKYGDNLWLREMSGYDLERFVCRKVKLRCRISDPDDPSDPSEVTMPEFGPIDIPNIEGYKIYGCYAPAFSIDPSASFDPSHPDPSVSDLGVVRVVAAPSGPRSIRFALLTMDAPGEWPGATAGNLVTPKIRTAQDRGGLTQEGASGGAPATASHARPTIVVYLEDITDYDVVDPSDPSASLSYKLVLADGTTLKIDVPVGDDQPQLKRPWPLDQEEGRFNYQVLDTHQEMMEAKPRRNAYVVPNITDDPLHAQRGVGTDGQVLKVSSVRTETTQDPVAGNVEVTRVTLSDGSTITGAEGVTYVEGMDYDPSGNDPSEGDPSGLSQEAINPADYWEFEMMLILERADGDEDTVGGGFAPDVWQLLPDVE